MVKLLAISIIVFATTFCTAALGKCRPPSEITLVEIELLSCRDAEGGVLLTARVQGEASFPWQGIYSGLDPDLWQINQYAEAPTREYFHFTKKSCEAVMDRQDVSLIMQQSRACCDVITEPMHQSCSMNLLRFAPEWLIELGATSDA